jgi:hypothetical protein
LDLTFFHMDVVEEKRVNPERGLTGFPEAVFHR